MSKIVLSKEDYKAIASLRRSPHAARCRGVLERHLAAARDEYELTAPADEELRFRVLEIRTALNVLFVDPITQEKQS